MQFKHLFLAVVAAALSGTMSIAAALPEPESSLSCLDPTHPCNTYSSFPDCSDEYIKTLSKCQSTGCIQWVMDPLAHCKCDSPMHACQTYTSHKDCSPEYIADLKECVYTGCLQWVQDPLKHCNYY